MVAGRSIGLLSLLLLLSAPAQACSARYEPFHEPQFADGLWYMSGHELRHVVGSREEAVTLRFFLDYLAVGDDGLLLSYQDDYDVDCSGTPYTSLWRAGEDVWVRKGASTFIPTSGGPLLHHQGAIWRLDGDELVLIESFARPDDASIVGWSSEGVPVLRREHELSIGHLTIPLTFAVDATASHENTVAIAGVGDDGLAHVLQVRAGKITETTWRLSDGEIDQMVWAGGWLLSTERWIEEPREEARAYLVRGNRVTDLGLDDVIAVAARDGKPVVFAGDSDAVIYTLYAGSTPVAAASRDLTETHGTWRPFSTTARPFDVASAQESGVPSPGALLALVAVALALGWRRQMVT